MFVRQALVQRWQWHTPPYLLAYLPKGEMRPKPVASDLSAGRPQDRRGPMDGMTIIDPLENTAVDFQTGGHKNSASAGIPGNVEPKSAHGADPIYR